MAYLQSILAVLVAVNLAVGGPASAKTNSLTATHASIAWLARQQLKDGSWSFAAPPGKPGGYANPSTWKADTGATALALLSFLGANQTHKSKGLYGHNVKDGIDWLMAHQKPNGDLAADDASKALSHALATLALTEAYGLSGDKPVGFAAQRAVNFIVKSQDAKIGGWSESAGKPPVLSITAWQILALRSAKMAVLDVPPAVLKKTGGFLAGMQAADGRYGETGPPDASDAATAMGLLGRLYLGGDPWTLTVFGGRHMVYHLSEPENSAKRSNDSHAWAKRGQQFLAQAGPSPKDCVYNLYATVYMHALSGDEWDAWNRKMRKLVLDTQVQTGTESGSWWNPDDVHAAEGGRLLQTVIHSLMLEVY